MSRTLPPPNEFAQRAFTYALMGFEAGLGRDRKPDGEPFELAAFEWGREIAAKIWADVEGAKL